ncbi:MAG TPA: mandelate racemase/muconate lactonizing enzyme family protein, partial [Acetobacteraceae bacterium]|nr:mandelate racemase/muconate lactonizing enzyme family protein [Acetobacteraceae bacterium]
GWGEIWCNFPTIGAEHRARLFDGMIAPRLLGRDPDANPADFWHESDRALHVWGIQCGEPGAFAAALAGADIALHDLAARRAGVPLWRWLGGRDGSPVPAYASGLNPDAQALAQVEAARAAGYTRFKIKIGFGEARDLATLEPVFASLHPGERVMVDANQGWDLATACRMAGLLARWPLGWIEEPLRADRPAHEWALVRTAAAAPLAAGENLRGLPAYLDALRDGYLAVVQPDICKWGGLSATLPVARAILGAGRSYCPHFLGGGVGLMASLHLLGAVRGPGLVEVDANPNPLREDVLGEHLRVRDGALALTAGPGLGFAPELAPFASMRTLHLETRTGA